VGVTGTVGCAGCGAGIGAGAGAGAGVGAGATGATTGATGAGVGVAAGTGFAGVTGTTEAAGEVPLSEAGAADAAPPTMPTTRQDAIAPAVAASAARRRPALSSIRDMVSNAS